VRKHFGVLRVARVSLMVSSRQPINTGWAARPCFLQPSPVSGKLCWSHSQQKQRSGGKMLETFRHCREKASKARSQPLEPEPEPEPEPGPEPEPEPELPWLDLPEGTPHE
jgi:hypothetical protein